MNPSTLIDKKIEELVDWRGTVFKDLRKLIHEVDPKVKEEWKWNTAVFVNQGMVCAIASFKDHVRLNFFKGAGLKDQSLFNAGLDAKTSRGIDFREGDRLNEAALNRLIKSAVALNLTKPK